MEPKNWATYLAIKSTCTQRGLLGFRQRSEAGTAGGDGAHPVNVTHHITVHGGSDAERAVRNAMRQSDAELIASLKRAERADFRMAIV